MMPVFQIIEAKPHHCGAMARVLRDEHKRAIEVMGLNVHRELRRTFDRSSFRKAWLIDGRLSGLGGITGTMASPLGYVWLLLSQHAVKHKLEIVRESRKQLREIMQIKKELATTIIDSDAAAKRLALFLGFHVEDHGDGQRAMTRDQRRRLAAYVDHCDSHRIAIGKGFVTAVGYHEEAA